MAENVYKKLAAVQANLKAPKGQYNAFADFKYRSCEDILEALKPLLKEQGLVINLSDTIIAVGDRYYVQAIATLIDVDTGEKVLASASAREQEEKKKMDASQVTGAASSYARKYALNGLLAIDDTKDSDYYDNSKDTYTTQTRPQTFSKSKKVMTLEEAKQTRVQSGQFESLTLWEVAENNLQVLKERLKIAQDGDRKDALKLIIDEKEKA